MKTSFLGWQFIQIRLRVRGCEQRCDNQDNEVIELMLPVTMQGISASLNHDVHGLYEMRVGVSLTSQHWSQVAQHVQMACPCAFDRVTNSTHQQNYKISEIAT